jgi:hypothetical protein
MPEINTPPCPLHGDRPRALHTENFEGIVQVIDELLLTVSGVVGTTTYTRCPYGYPSNFEGVVRALEDLNASISGIQGGGGGGSNVVGGSGIYLTSSGIYDIINADYGAIVSGALVAGSNIDFDYLSGGRLEINSTATISGVQSAVYVQDSAPPEPSAHCGSILRKGACLFTTQPASGLKLTPKLWRLRVKYRLRAQDSTHRRGMAACGSTLSWATCSYTTPPQAVGTKLAPLAHSLTVLLLLLRVFLVLVGLTLIPNRLRFGMVRSGPILQLVEGRSEDG